MGDLRSFHAVSPLPIRLARLDYGDLQVDKWLRGRVLRRVRTDSVDVVMLGSAGRRLLGLSKGGRLPSLDGLKQLQARGAVVRRLVLEGWVFVRHVSPFAFWVERAGEVMLVVVNVRGYDRRGLRKRIPALLNEVLVSGGSVMVFDRFHDRVESLAVRFGSVVSARSLRDVLQVGYGHLSRGW